MTADVPTADLSQTEPGPAARQSASNDEFDRQETASIAMTSLAALGTAWSAFQAATWSGRQTFAIARATSLRQLSTEARLEGDQQMEFDATLFVAFANAYSQGNEKFATFLHDRFPQRLRRATDAWLATNPRTSHDAPPHPFAMSEYHVEAHERARTLGKDADEVFTQGHEANRTSDTYVLGTVIFATIILFGSLVMRLHRNRTRRAMLLVTAVVLFTSIIWLVLRPIAWVG